MAAACLPWNMGLAGPFGEPATALASTCPNAAIRAEQGAAALALPDCRAYEMVSPFGTILDSVHPSNTRVATSGEAITYASFYPYPATQNEGRNLLSTRGADGWMTESVMPPQNGAGTSDYFACAPSILFAADLSRAVLMDGFRDPEGYSCVGDEPPLVPGEARGVANLFLRDSATGSYQLISVTPEGVPIGDAWLEGVSTDFGHVVFGSEAQLTPEAPSGASNTFEWSEGVVRLLTWAPDGTPVRGTLASPSTSANPVSADGERAFFTAAGGLYLRENAMAPQSPVLGGECTDPTLACTVQIDSPQTGATGVAGGGAFQYATEDGSRVFFTDESRLTEDSTAAAGKPDLYEYDLRAPAGDRLADLTVDGSEPAGVLRFVGSSEGASYLYFIAQGVLTSTPNSRGEAASPGDCEGVRITGFHGTCNLYLRHGSATTFIGSLSAEDVVTGAQVSPDGRYLGFGSTHRLTGFDNAPAEPGECAAEGCRELFLYEAEANRLGCVSCDAGGAAPVGETQLTVGAGSPFLGPGKTAEVPPYRSVFDDGRVFFETPNPLGATDVNGRVPDVYEYENGHAQLISSGTASGASQFEGAGASGDDAFFTTEVPLVRRDGDNATSLYDARVGGGFPEPPPPPPCESEEACHGGGPEAPVLSSPATSHFEGPGNPREKRCRKGLVRRHGRCVKRHHGKHHHGKHHHGKHHHSKRANRDRRTHR